MIENYRQMEECFISYKAFNIYSTLLHDDQLRIRPLFKSIANCTPQMLPVIPIPGVAGNFRWRLEKYSLILKIYMGRLVLEDILENNFLDSLYTK